MMIKMESKMCKYSFILIVVVALSSCYRGVGIYSLINDKWQKCETEDKCVMNMVETTWFEWDLMYYFSGSIYLDDTSLILGLELDCYSDVGDRLIFIKNDKVVYCEEYFPYPSSQVSSGLIIESDRSYLKFSNADALFTLFKKGDFYYLTPLNEPAD